MSRSSPSNPLEQEALQALRDARLELTRLDRAIYENRGQAPSRWLNEERKKAWDKWREAAKQWYYVRAKG